MSMLHNAPGGDFCCGEMLPLKKAVQPLMGVVVNGIALTGPEFTQVRCILCGAQALLGAPTRVPQTIDVPFEVITEGTNEPVSQVQ